MKKRIAKLIGVILSVSMVLASSAPAFAAETAAENTNGEYLLSAEPDSETDAGDIPEADPDTDTLEIPEEYQIIESPDDASLDEVSDPASLLAEISEESGQNNKESGGTALPEISGEGSDVKDGTEAIEGSDGKKESEDKPVYKTGLYNVDGIWKYFEDGEFSNKTGAVKRADNGEICYVRNGVFKKATGLVNSLFDNNKYYVKNGVFQAATGITKSLFNSKRYYVKNGLFNGSTGVAKSLFNKKRYYVKKGVVTTSTGVAKSLFNQKYYYVKKGVVTVATGVAKSLFNKKYYYVRKGVFKKATGAAKMLSGKKICFVKNGVLTRSTGVAKSLFNKKYYYVKKGAFKKATGLAKDLTGNGLRYVRNGIQKGKTGYAERISDGRLFYVTAGRYTGSMTDLPDYTGDYNGRYYQHSYTLTGWRLIGKECYYYKKGILQTNRTAGGLYLDSNGVASGSLERLVPLKARLIVESITNDSMTKEEKLHAAFMHVVSYDEIGFPRIPHYKGMDWPYVYANDMFSGNGGNCFSYGAAFAFLAKYCGCSESYACGGGHGFAEVDGLVYDPEVYKNYPNTRPIYAKSYDDPMVSGYWSVVYDWHTNPSKRIRIPD